jgi:DNA-binding NarL/FixJ family response regulator
MVTPRIRVLCVDDHRLVRRGIISLIDLEPDMSVVAEASDGEEAVEQFKRHRPGVTLMDLELPRMNGVAAIRAIRHEQPDAPIIVLTMYQGDEDIYRAVQAGAAAYLLKDAVPEVLIGVIRRVHAGGQVFPPDILSVMKQRASAPALTAREHQVLELLAAGKRTKEIATQLRISGETVDGHIKSMYVKLKVHGRTAIVAEALRRGIVRIDTNLRRG